MEGGGRYSSRVSCFLSSLQELQGVFSPIRSCINHLRYSGAVPTKEQVGPCRSGSPAPVKAAALNRNEESHRWRHPCKASFDIICEETNPTQFSHTDVIQKSRASESIVQAYFPALSQYLIGIRFLYYPVYRHRITPRHRRPSTRGISK